MNELDRIVLCLLVITILRIHLEMKNLERWSLSIFTSTMSMLFVFMYMVYCAVKYWAIDAAVKPICTTLQ